VPEGSPAEPAPRNVDLDDRGRCDTDRALTWEGDVAVRPAEPEGDVSGAGKIPEG
jgi:hypothetical protein